MCLAVPGKILEISETMSGRVARVQFGGITRPVQLDFVPEAGIGDYVVTHVGFAISRVDAGGRPNFRNVECDGAARKRTVAAMSSSPPPPVRTPALG